MHVQLSRHVSTINVDGTTVLLVDNGDAAVLNSSGSWILEKLLEEDSTDALASAICMRFDANPSEVITDLHSFINKLSEHELVAFNEQAT